MRGEEPPESPARAANASGQVSGWTFARTFESLRFRDYRLLWLGQGGTSMGQWMDQVARGWLIYQLTGSALELGAVSAMRAVPMLLFGVVAGVVADRYGRKAQLIISQLTNVIINVVLATLILTGRIEVWHIYATAFLAGAVQAFQQPARQSLISDLVGREHLANAVALNSAIFNLMRSVGPAVAGGLIAVVGVDGSYYAQAALYLWATLWTVQMRVPGEPGLLELLGIRQPDSRTASAEPPAEPGAGHTRAHRGASGRKAPEGSFFGSLFDGFRYLGSNRMMLSLMVLGLAPVLLGMPYVSLMPVFAQDVLDVGPVGQGMMLTATGVGALVGALGIASIGNIRRKGLLLLGGAVLFGVSLVAFSQARSFPLALAFLFVSGLANGSYTSQNQTVIQLLAPREMRGRVISILMLNRGLMPLGALLAGALAHWLDGPTAVTAMGTSCALLAIVIAVAIPKIRDLRV